MKGFITTAAVLVMAFTLLNGVQAARIRLSLSPSHKMNVSRKVSASMFAEPCLNDDVNNDEVSEVQTADLNNEELRELDQLRDVTKFFRSDEVTAKVLSLLDVNVAGTEIKSQTFLDEMREIGCSVYIFGGAVRDILMGKDIGDIKDIDADTGCEIIRVKEMCLEKFSEQYCFEHGPFFHFGSVDNRPEQLDIAYFENNFKQEKMTNLEYSPNTIAYEYNQDNVIVDFTGYSLSDVCQKKIRFPVADDDRDAWTADRGDDTGRKIFRYWKLIVKGFSPLNDEVKNYVVNKARAFIEVDDWLAMKKYYCDILFGTRDLVEDNAGCDKDRDYCSQEAVQAKAHAFRTAVSTDLNDEWKPPRCGLAEFGLED